MGVNTRESLEQVIQHVQKTKRNIDLILITGDLTHDETTKGYERLRAMLDPLQVPIYLLPGNHDVPALMHETLPSKWISLQSQILLDHWQIIMLDSTIENSESGRLNENQLRLLHTSLEQHPDLHALVCLHHQPIAMGSAWLDTMQLENSKGFFDILSHHPQVKAVLWGHVHQEFSRQSGQMQLLASPSTCKQFTPLSEEYAIDENRGAGYRWLCLSKDGSIDTEVVWT